MRFILHQYLFPRIGRDSGSTAGLSLKSPRFLSSRWGPPHLARSLEHLLDVVRTLEARGAYLRVLGDPIDTATPQGRFMLQMLGAVAEFERALIRERVASGLARAAREGRRGGNPGVVARDPEALRRLRHAREDAYLARVTAHASEWLPLVIRLRTEEGRTWDDRAEIVGKRSRRTRPLQLSFAIFAASVGRYRPISPCFP
ncbi:recombinase family protein [Rhodopila globiformis]|uniref:Resolvase/invertase-type recombinase catalytic domain-containing protein n=1 Tax=Rhodopila globiformis TaxID=1071 RepID=A0A2S6NFV7_RHOGL|nr:recombinase family protein [Rhodopila globiformis]PPQ33470.1 hypothetical protein CCS01_14150 [Rhodopila globiformis]